MLKKKSSIDGTDIFSKTLDSFLPDTIKKALVIALGGALLTEEAVRKLLVELKLPKDLINFIIQQTNKSKNEILRIISEEFNKLISQVNINNELKKVIKDLKINATVEITFEDKKEGDKQVNIETQVQKKSHKKTPKKEKKDSTSKTKKV